MTERTPTPTGRPRLEPTSLEESGRFIKAVGLVLDEISGTRVTGQIDLSADHHTVGWLNALSRLRAA